MLAATSLSSWVNLSRTHFTWTIDDPQSGVTAVVIEQQVEGATTWQQLATWSGTASSRTTGTAALINPQDRTVYTVRFTVRDAVGNQGYVYRTFKTDFQSPVAHMQDPTDPGSTDVYLPTAWTTVTVTGTDDWAGTTQSGSGVAVYEIQYGPTNGLYTDWMYTRRLYQPVGRSSASIRIRFEPDTAYKFRVKAVDHAGNPTRYPGGPDGTTTEWHATHVTYHAGSSLEGYVETLIPLFRPRVVAPPAAPPIDNIRRQSEQTPYPLPDK